MWYLFRNVWMVKGTHMKRKVALIIFLVILMSTVSIAKANRQAVALVSSNPARIGQASWYSKRDRGIRRHTANNEIFDDTVFTAAMWDVPFNQKVRVTNRENGKSIIVRINDRGPHRRFARSGRIIDLTKTAFAKIGSTKSGLIDVELELLD